MHGLAHEPLTPKLQFGTLKRFPSPRDVCLGVSRVVIEVSLGLLVDGCGTGRNTLIEMGCSPTFVVEGLIQLEDL